MRNFAISLYKPNDTKAKEPFSIVVKSTNSENIEKFYNPNTKTFVSEKAEPFLERIMGAKEMFKKEYYISLEKDGGDQIAQIGICYYNIPYMVEKNYNLSLLLSDGNSNGFFSDKWEDSFILSLMDEDSFPSAEIFQTTRPIVLVRDLIVAPDERNKGYGGYLFRSFEDYLRGMMGLDFGTIFAVNLTMATKEDNLDEQDFGKYYENKQSIILKWFEEEGYKSYLSDPLSGLKFFQKSVG